MLSAKFCRTLSGFLFLTGNVLLFVTNLPDPNVFQLVSSLLFMSCSVSLILSALSHRWLFWGSGALMAAYLLIALGATGDGTFMQYLGAVTGVISAVFIFRSALKSEFNRQFILPRPLNLLDEFPLATAGFIEGPCCVLICIGAVLSGTYHLAASAGLWTVAHGFLIASDVSLRQRLALPQGNSL